MSDYRTSLKTVRGHGAAKGGTDHFIRQRVTGIANVFVVAFIIYAVLHLAGQPQTQVKQFFQAPFNAIMGVLLGLSASVHMRIGMQVVIEDYVHGRAKVPLLLLNTFFTIVIGVAIVLAVAKLYLGV